jgi:aspartyl-tRNA(Asn)/glutamyl-tRNA(Gln) amidotransferase subunit A
VAQRSLARLFEDVDVIMTPTISVGAPSYAELDTVGLARQMQTLFTGYWDAVGNPVLAFPMGFTAAGLPLSAQIAGRPFAEDTLVRVADAYQQQTDWHLRTPAPESSPADRHPETAAEHGDSASASALPAKAHSGCVDSILTAAGLLEVAPDERDAFAAAYAGSRAELEAMYALPETRYEVPALVFQAAPKLSQWGER